MVRLGRYEIQSELGRGGMGVVAKAFDTAIARTVAIKTINLREHGTPAESEMLRERLVREARAAGTLSHPNIVSVYDIGQEGDVAYIVMEYVEGRTLDQLLSETPQAGSLDLYLRILSDSAQGLDHAHSRGIVHRDVKPANIMVRSDGAVKIADFGIAKVPSAHTITQTGMTVGSPHYMAPEQLKAEPVTGRSDQFSLAAVAYVLLTGRRPFEADTVATLMSLILFEEPPPARALNPALSLDVERVLRKGLSKAPQDRFATCVEFVDALKTALQAQPPPPRPVVQPAAPAPSPRQRTWFPVLLALPVVLAMAGLAYYFYLRFQETGTPLAPPSRAGVTRANPIDGMTYVWVPPGSFLMGCPPGDPACLLHEMPAHRVAITRGFWLGRSEVTVAAYEHFARATGRAMPPAPTFDPGWAARFNPIVNVTWHEAAAYCQWAGGRLPTEAEWEYAAGIGDPGTPVHSLDTVAWYAANSPGGARQVASKSPSPLGLYDLLGNVWERCSDWYEEDYYAASPPSDPAGPPAGADKVVRGGSWADNSPSLRLANRFKIDPAARYDNVGIRCALAELP